jgi:hypothetical protein
MLLCEALGLFAPAEYISKIADALQGCSETEDPFLLERGWTLYNLLLSIHKCAAAESADRVAEIFPGDVVNTIHASRDCILASLNRVDCARQSDALLVL